MVELSLQVEEPGVGYVVWSEVDDLAQAGRDSRVYALDREAGTVRFGDGVRGRIPESGMRIRAAVLRAGGGAAGNLPPLALTNVEGRDLSGATVTRKLKVVQSLALDGGQEAETLAMAEQRIPGLLRHGNRAVTAEDYRRLALDTPGAAVARVEVLPRFKPQQMRQNTPGVVSVMVLPEKALPQPPNPRPDRPFLETVHAYLDERRTLGTELYTIGCEYVSVGIGVGITVHEGLEFAAVVNAVREALRRFLWPLPPGGPDGQGWPLGRGVSDREVEVAVARVSGVAGVAQINLFRKKETEGQEPRWQHIERLSEHEPVVIELAPWQLPELLSAKPMSDRTLLGGAGLALLVLGGIFGPLLWRHSPLAQDLDHLLQPPSWQHPLGTDESGCDLLAELLRGARLAAGISLSVVTLCLGTGVVIGTAAGYLGRRWDEVIMRVIDILVLRPSIDLGMLAREYEPRLPRVFRFLTRGLGTRKSASPDILSLVMFQEDFLKRVIALGEEDAEQHAAHLAEFLETGGGGPVVGG